MKTIAFLMLAGLVYAGIAYGEEGEEAPVPGPKVFKKIVPKHGNVIVELRGREDGLGFPTDAWTVELSSGTRTFLGASWDTYIIGASVSDDGKYIVLRYHISSGGFAEAFAQVKAGQYRKLFDNSYAAEQIEAGSVPGLEAVDVPWIRRSRNVFYGLRLANSPDRLIFDMGALAVTYSLEQGRITEWQRSILGSSFSRGKRNLSLDIVEPTRFIARIP